MSNTKNDNKKDSAQPKKFVRPGDFLFKEGESAQSLYIIQKGTLSIRKMKGPEYIEVARLYTNEVIGEVSFFDRSARSAAAVALTEVEVLEITYASLDKIYTAIPPYMKTIMAAMAERLRKADDQIRKLQKDIVQDESVDLSKDEGPSAAEVLAATEDVAKPENK